MALLEVAQSRQITATVRLEEKTAVQVDQYAAFIRASADEVVNQALDYVFTKDRDFQEYLKSADAGSAVPSLRVRRAPQPAAGQENRRTPRKQGCRDCAACSVVPETDCFAGPSLGGAARRE